MYPGASRALLPHRDTGLALIEAQWGHPGREQVAGSCLQQAEPSRQPSAMLLLGQPCPWDHCCGPSGSKDAQHHPPHGGSTKAAAGASPGLTCQQLAQWDQTGAPKATRDAKMRTGGCWPNCPPYVISF